MTNTISQLLAIVGHHSNGWSITVELAGMVKYSTVLVANTINIGILMECNTYNTIAPLQHTTGTKNGAKYKNQLEVGMEVLKSTLTRKTGMQTDE